MIVKMITLFHCPTTRRYSPRSPRCELFVGPEKIAGSLAPRHPFEVIPPIFKINRYDSANTAAVKKGKRKSPRKNPQRHRLKEVCSFFFGNPKIISVILSVPGTYLFRSPPLAPRAVPPRSEPPLASESLALLPSASQYPVALAPSRTAGLASRI